MFLNIFRGVDTIHHSEILKPLAVLFSFYWALFKRAVHGMPFKR